MMNIFAGIFFVLHAFVHLLYAGQAARWFELRPGLAWPEGAWLLARLLGHSAACWLAAPRSGLFCAHDCPAVNLYQYNW
jgi:hypothetical protein